MLNNRKQGFVHLHCHTEYSLLDSAARMELLIRRAKELNMPALAITDHGNMHGVIDFYKIANAEGIKPILGCEIFVAPVLRFQQETERDHLQHHLVLLAMNNEGYRNLIQLVSAGHAEGLYNEPLVTKNMLEKYSTGLIALSACREGETPSLVMQGRTEQAHTVARYFRDLFGRDNFFLELQDHGLAEQKHINEKLIEIGQAEDIKLVASNDIHYLTRENAAVNDILLAIQSGKTIKESDRMKSGSDQLYLKTTGEMAAMFSQCPIAIENSLHIAERCNVEIGFNRNYAPKFNVPNQLDPNDYLKELCHQGMTRRYDNITDKMNERLDYEIEVICRLGYTNSLLIAWSLTQHARKEKVIIGPERGLAAGSLVAYLTDLSNIDPIKYGLLFTTVNKQEKPANPAIDIELCNDKRDLILDYLHDTYGHDRVAQITTFGIMSARSAIRDVGRAMGIPNAEVDQIINLIPLEPGMTISKALEQTEKLQTLYLQDKYRNLLDISIAVEGLPRHASVNAAGIIISKESLVKNVPLCKTSNNTLASQFPEKNLEELGLLRVNLIGQKVLNVIGNTFDNAEKRTGTRIDIDNIEPDNNTYKLLSQGETTGVFQLESTGMRAFLKELRPDNFEDIIAAIALYRPGSTEQIPELIKRKHGKIEIESAHPVLGSIIEETYGLLVYREQLIKIATVMAGFSLEQACLFVKAVSAKSNDSFAQLKQLFINGLIKYGQPKKEATEIFEMIQKLAPRCYSKSHAAGYALTAYQTAYLKTNYPTDYMTAYMETYFSNTAKVAEYRADYERLGHFMQNIKAE